jgi:hypothetical protein
MGVTSEHVENQEPESPESSESQQRRKRHQTPASLHPLRLVADPRSWNAKGVPDPFLAHVHRGAVAADRERGALLSDVPVESFGQPDSFVKAKAHLL